VLCTTDGIVRELCGCSVRFSRSVVRYRLACHVLFAPTANRAGVLLLLGADHLFDPLCVEAGSTVLQLFSFDTGCSTVPRRRARFRNELDPFRTFELVRIRALRSFPPTSHFFPSRIVALTPYTFPSGSILSYCSIKPITRYATSPNGLHRGPLSRPRDCFSSRSPPLQTSWTPSTRLYYIHALVLCHAPTVSLS